jgi:uncharacterized protein YabN with tetrapyrrole methylase and pyrophosphatase domain
MTEIQSQSHSSVEKTPLPFQIAVVGLGIVGVHQITREVEEVLRRSRSIFVVDSGYGIMDYLRSLCPAVFDIATLYEKGKNRLPTYQKMAAEVVSAAIADPPVCFATYGHPRVYCYPTTLIKRAGKLLDLDVEVFPGISSLDTMILDLDFDFATDGLQMYEATDILVRKRPLQNDVALLLWQCTTLCDPTYPDGPIRESQIRPLQDYLLRFYPPDHIVALVMSKTFPLLKSTVRRIPLGQLAREMAISPLSGTLFVPPVAARPIKNRKLLTSMYFQELRPPSGAASSEPSAQPAEPQE